MPLLGGGVGGPPDAGGPPGVGPGGGPPGGQNGALIFPTALLRTSRCLRSAWVLKIDLFV